MFATPAVAQTTSTAAAAPGGDIAGFLSNPANAQILMLVGMVLLFYFLMIRPQQTRMKAHQTMLAGVKRGDTVVLSSGMIGKIVRVEDKEVGVEVATGVTVKVVKSMISEVRSRGEPAPANDSKT